MSPPTTTLSPQALLCEGCGYPLDGERVDDACPECGKPVIESLPSARPGSAWQQGHGLGGWLTTSVRALTQPRMLYTEVAIEGHRANQLILFNTLIGAVLLTPVVLGVLEGVFPTAGVWGWGLIGSVPVVIAVLLVLLCVLTVVEQVGLRFWGRVHGLRVTSDVARTVTAHASVGWVAGGALTLAGVHLSAGLTTVTRGIDLGALRPISNAAPWVLPWLGAISGLLAFETLAYIGVRRCRYANGPGASARVAPSKDRPAGNEERSPDAPPGDRTSSRPVLGSDGAGA